MCYDYKTQTLDHEINNAKNMKGINEAIAKKEIKHEDDLSTLQTNELLQNMLPTSEASIINFIPYDRTP